MRVCRDDYTAENIFRVSKEARWSYLRARAKEPEIGRLADEAVVAIERQNPHVKNVLPKEYVRPTLDERRLGELIDLISTIPTLTRTTMARRSCTLATTLFLCL